MKNINIMKNIHSFIKSNCGIGGISSVSRRFLVLFITLLSLGVGNAWGDQSLNNVYMDWYFNDVQFYTVNNNASYGYANTDNRGDEVLYDLGVLTTDFKIKSIYWKVSTNWDPNCCNGWMKYQINGGSVQSMNYNSDCDNGNNQQIGGDFNPNHTVATSDGTPGIYYFVHWFEAYFCYQGGSNMASLSNSSKNYKFQYTIPGFTNLSSTSVTFDNTIVDGNNSKSITYTHYGNAPTYISERYSITGTNADQFSITALSGTGATIQFRPTTEGTKTATLVINDEYGKTTGSITLTGTTKVLVTYDKGTYGTGDTKTADKVYDTNLTLANAGYFTRTGYTQTAWNTNTAGTGGTSYSLNGTYSSNAATTLYPTWTPNQYTITLNGNGGSENTASVQATYDASSLSTAITNPTKTGYTFNGWHKDNGTGALIINTSGELQAGTDYTNGSSQWTNVGDVTLYAGWTANNYTVTLDVDEDHKGTISGATTDQTVTYDAATTTVPNLPTGEHGYGLDGYYTIANGGGFKLINEDGSWIASVEGYTDADKKWIHAGDVTLYAYYKKAEITLTPDAAVVAPNGSVGVTPTIEPTPAGTNVICWKLLYGNGNVYTPQPEFTQESPAGISNKVTFTAPATSGSYLVAAVLRKGSTCDAEVLDSVTTTIQVAGDHTVTIQYKDASGTTLQTSTTVTGKPLEWTENAITPADIFGYTFDHWVAGDGVTLSENGTSELGDDESTEPNIYIKAIYDGKLTAVYAQKNIIYFKDELNWTDPEDADAHVYVNFLNGSWWNSSRGTGNQNLAADRRNKEMSRVPGTTDVFYYEYGTAGTIPTRYVSFTKKSYDNYESFSESSGEPAFVCYPTIPNPNNSTTEMDYFGFDSKTPMFVPAATYPGDLWNNSQARYFNAGYWTKYTPGTGYYLRIYDPNDQNSLIKKIEFTSEDDLIPMTVTTDLEANKTYYFEVSREDEIFYSNGGIMDYDDRYGTVATPWELFRPSTYTKTRFTTTAAGDYIFHITHGGNQATHDDKDVWRLRIAAEYPIKNGDFRLVYSDGIQTKPLISAIVPQVNNGKDTVSFFIRPANASISLVIQQATVASNGSTTWSSPGTDITSEITNARCPQDSVYNICLKMGENGAISVENIEAYTGEYYIRTDAANNKWDNYRAADHMMTYSEYSENNSDFTHYWMKFVSEGTNVKFVVANDYSPNISDTLIVQTYRDGDSYHVDGNGFLNNDLLGDGVNIRFMWNRHTNTIMRAYLAPAQSDGSKFLVLRANSNTDLMDEYGNALLNSANSGQSGYNHKAEDNSIQFVDDENWIYETTVMIKPSAFVKLYGHFHDKDFYFKGKDNNTFDASNAIQLISGSGDAVKVRVVYDFKTDRLLAAYLPSGNITENKVINADVMFIREHQGDIAQLTVASGKAISKITSAYGVMRFNKYTLNNKSKADGHAVLASPASVYERSLYFISFPFRVKLNDIFGFGTYGTHWAIMKYNGARRAAEGFWEESSGFWEWMNRNTEYLEPNQGYLLSIDIDLLGEDNTDIWGPESRSSEIELFFPSYGSMPDITSSNVVMTLPKHECKIDRSKDASGNPTGLPDTGDPSTSYNRTVFDSHWNVMSVPTYVNTNNVTFANTTWTTEGAGKQGPNFLYTWNMDDNTLTPTAGSGYTYHAMHAYMVQYEGDVTWSASSGSSYPSSIVARRTYAEQPRKMNFNLEIQQDEKMIDRTCIQLSDDEEVSTGFAFGEDMTKEFNSRKANIYTFVEGMSVAGNTLPMSEQTTIIPVGAKITANGEYTFTIPEGTEGVGVVLVDNEANTRTNLSALNYTVTLNKGTYNSRFILEISPVQNSATDIETVSDQHSEVRKIMIDGVLYIVRDDKIFDARGARVK